MASLFVAFVCCIFCAKPLSKPIIVGTSVKSEPKYKIHNSRKSFWNYSLQVVVIFLSLNISIRRSGALIVLRLVIPLSSHVTAPFFIILVRLLHSLMDYCTIRWFWFQSCRHYLCNIKDDSRFTPSQWRTALLCHDVSHWLGANLESALNIAIDKVRLNHNNLNSITACFLTMERTSKYIHYNKRRFRHLITYYKVSVYRSGLYLHETWDSSELK